MEEVAVDVAAVGNLDTAHYHYPTLVFRFAFVDALQLEKSLSRNIYDHQCLILWGVNRDMATLVDGYSTTI